MIINIILGVVALLLLIIVIKFITGKGKPSDRRTGMEKIACTLFSIFRKNTEDVARGLRTAKVMKDEALQEVTDALNRLESSYREGQISMKTALKRLKEEILPDLKDKPGSLEAKARKYKKQYQESIEAGHPIEAHKQNAIKALQHKAKALESIKKAEKNIEKLEVAIETSKADYDGNRMDLEIIKADLEAMIDIPQVELNDSLARINSIQNELTSRMNEAAIRQEVEAEMRNENININSDMNAEFEAL